MIHTFLALIGCLLNALWSLGPLHAYGHVRCFSETSFSATFLHPPRREVHACARHGPYFFGGLRSFISNPLLFESGTSQTVVLHKSQDIKFVSFKMLCLYMQDVNWFYLYEEGKVVLLNCFVLIEARLWYDLCCRYFHT